VVDFFPLQKAGVVLMTNDFVSDGREGELLKLVLLLIKRGSHLFENKKQFAAYLSSMQVLFRRSSPIDVAHVRVSNKTSNKRPCKFSEKLND